ncbi:hypothetical protein BDF19DRAFT_419801 [Syncephalis fuscata]|nr:hypothetical protein BDF19DRAFT_419801 [Syncephalis fuscata]
MTETTATMAPTVNALPTPLGSGGDETATSLTVDPDRTFPPHHYSPMSTMESPMPPHPPPSHPVSSSMPPNYGSNHPEPPTLKDVLSRRSNPPVCLYNYYLYLRDREQTQHYLDFWLDVTAHENRCRIYCKNIIRASKRLTATSILTNNNNNTLNIHPPNSHQSTLPDKPNRASWGRLSIRDVSNELRYSTISQQTNTGTFDHSEGTGTLSILSEMSGSQRYRNSKTSDQMIDFSQPTGEYDAAGSQDNGAEGDGTGRSKKAPLSREDIHRSARKIYRRYMIPGARRELHFPESIRYPIVQAIEVEHRDDPEIFLEAKEYVFRLMEQCYFPRFIEERTRHNLSEKQATLRMVAGLMILFIGFTVEFSLIFLNRRRTLRLYGIIPILLAIINLFAYLTRFCPFFTLFGSTETSYLRYAQIKDNFIRRYHRIRALKLFAGALLLTLVIVGIFMAPPGHRL